MQNKYVNDFTENVQAYYKNISQNKPLTKAEEKELFLKAKNENDMEARDKILSSNLKFVFSVAKKYKGKGVPLEDLISEGNLGLLYAYDKFDISKDTKFITYAVWWINWYIQDFIKKRYAVMENESSDEDLLSTPIKRPTQDDDSLKLGDIIMSDETDSILLDEKETNEKMLSKLINQLDEREKIIIKAYFGFDDDKPKTLKECGELLGLSQERCRQIKEKTLLKLKNAMEHFVYK